MTILAPKDFEELENMLEWSAHFYHPLAIRYPKYVPVHKYSVHESFRPGSWEWLAKGEEEVVVLACGALMNDFAMSVHDKYGGFDVVNARSVNPVDEKLLKSIAGKKIITLEDNVLPGGFGSGVAEFYIANGIAVPRMIIKAADGSKLTHASLSQLMQMNGFTEESLLAAVNSLKQ